MIDITYDSVWNGLIDLMRSKNTPYIHIDITIKPFARTFFKFIESINTYDVAMILENEKGMNKRLSWLNSHVKFCLLLVSYFIEFPL